MAEYCDRTGAHVEICPIGELKVCLAPSLPCDNCEKDSERGGSDFAYHNLSECTKSCLLLKDFNRKVEETAYNHDCLSCGLYPHQ